MIPPTNRPHRSRSPRGKATPDYRPQPYNPPVAEIGRATAHLEGLRRHLIALGHPAEAAAVSTALDLLIPQRFAARNVAWPPR